jgi:hypothetical protein
VQAHAPIPREFSPLCLGPATNPSSDMEIFKRDFDMSHHLEILSCGLTPAHEDHDAGTTAFKKGY